MTKKEVRISTRKLCEDFEPMDDIEEFIKEIERLTNPRLSAATLQVQGEGESVEAFLSRCDRESTT